MENAELIIYILRDEDNIRKVKEWIASREEMDQASLAAASYSAMPLQEFLASLPSAELSKMIQDLNLFEGPSSPDTSMAQGCPSDLRGDLASPDHVPYHVPAELEQNDDTTDEVQSPKMNQDQEINMDGEEEAYLMFKQNMMQRKACQQIAPGDNEQSSIENKERNMPNVGFDVSVGAGWPLSGILQHSSESKQDRKQMKETIAVERNILSHTSEHVIVQSGVGRYNCQTASVDSQQYSEDEPVLSTPVRVMEEERNVSRDAENVDVNAQGGARFIPGQSHWHTHSSVDTSPQSPNLQLQQQGHVQLALAETVNSLSRILENISSTTRSDQSTSDSLKAEIKSLKKSIISMGQQIEKLKEQNIIQDEIIKGYEETINNKNQQLAENFSVIQYFHKIMTERKNKIEKLEKALEILEDKHKEEKNQELKKVAEREEEEYSQVFEKIKMQTEMIQSLYEEHLVLKEDLRQKCDEYSELQREIALLKEASLKEKLEKEKAKQMIQNLYQEKQVLKEDLRQKCDIKSNDLHKEIASLKEEKKLLQEKLDILKAEKLEEEKAKQVLQENNAQLIEGINNETRLLVQAYDELKVAFVQKKGSALRANLNYSERKRDYEDYPSKP